MDDTKELQTHMDKTIAQLEQEFVNIRAGRANPAILDKISVDYYGVPTQINAMAAISVSDARVLVITPWDITTLKAVEKAILASNIGITPANDGKALRLAFPQLTEERRKELTKKVHTLSEQAKVAVRNIRRDAIDKYKAKKKANELTEDDLKTIEKDVQKVTENFCDKIDKLSEEKCKELLTV